MIDCRICNGTLAPVLDLTSQSGLLLAVCNSCATMQLGENPIALLTSITREPEEHLDELAVLIRSLRLGPDPQMVGFSYKDKTLLDRLNRLGFAFAEPRKKVDVTIARHALEHAPWPNDFIKLMLKTLNPGGFLIIEVPDCDASLRARDYTMPWEHHTLYFTPPTLMAFLVRMGLVIVCCKTYRSDPEPSTVVIATRPNKDQPVAIHPLLRDYQARFADETARFHNLFATLTHGGKTLAAYGAGHLTRTFLENHGVAKFFSVIIDDDPAKAGSLVLHDDTVWLPVVGRELLLDADPAAIFLGMGVSVEPKVIANNPDVKVPWYSFSPFSSRFPK